MPITYQFKFLSYAITYAILQRNALRLATLLCIALVLTACGSSSTQTAPNTNIDLQISNSTGVDFASLSITDRASGQIVYNEAISCTAFEQDCMVTYAGPAIRGTAILEFKDKAGITVAYYDTASMPGKYVSATIDNFTTGAFLYEELVTLNASLDAMSIGDLAYRLELFTADYPAGSSDDIYDQLSAYFRYQQTIQPQTASVFAANLAQRLMNGDVAQRAEFITASTPPLALLAASSADTPKCPPGFSNLIFLLADVVGERFSKSLKPYFKQIGKIGGDACKPGGGIKLSDILNALNNLQSSVDNIQNNLGALSNFVAKVKLEDKLKSYDTTTKDLVALSENYKNLLRLNGVTTLKTYIEKNYGTDGAALDRALAADAISGVLTTIIEVAGANRSGGFLKNIDQLTAGDITLIDGLNLLCSNPSTGDVVQQRSLCNMVISSTVARLAANQDMALILASEGYAVFDAYPSTARRYGYDVTRGAPAYTQSLNDKFYNQKANLASSYQNIVNSDGSTGYFKLVDGLSTTLLANLKTVNCYDTDEKSYLISGWVKEAANEYLITNCNSYVTRASNYPIPVQARYYLRIDNTAVSGSDSVTNVMGVLIPSNKKDFNNATNYPLDKSRWGVKLLAFKAEYAPKPGTFITNGENVVPSSNIVNASLFDGPPQRLSFDSMASDGVTKGILNPTGLSIYHQACGSSRLKVSNWIRHTDQNLFSYILLLKSGISDLPQWCYQSSLYCVTGDCKNGKVSEGKANELDFTLGPKALRLGVVDEPSYLFGWQINGVFIDAK